MTGRFKTGHGSGRIGGGLVNQENWDVVSHRVDAAALRAFQAFASLLEQQQRFFAGGANQYVQQVLGNHAEYFTPTRANAHNREIPRPA